MTHSTIEDDAMVFGSLHQAQEVSVMLLRSAAKDAYIIMNGNYAGQKSVAWSIHNLKSILGHFQTK